MLRRDWNHRLLLIAASLALLGAAALVMTLQHDAERRQREQTVQILTQLCWQTGRLVRQGLRDNFGTAVSDTIEGIGHPELMRYELPRIATYFNSGQRDLYVGRFFLWSRRMHPPREGEVLFYRSGEEREGEIAADTTIVGDDERVLGALYRSPGLGRLIWSRAADLIRFKRSFAVVDERFDDRQVQLLIHYLWSDAQRENLAVIIGYTVDFARLRNGRMQVMVKQALAGVSEPASRDLDVTILDDAGHFVVGVPPLPGVPSASVPLEMMFMARAMEPFRVSGPATPPWTIVVSARTPVAAAVGSSYWMFAFVVLLILIGLAFAVALDRQTRRLAEMQSEFIAHVSHQLKTPLALLSGAAETLGRARVTSPAKIREYTGIVHAQTSRLSALVEQAIIFSAVDVDGAGLHFEVVDVAGLVRDAVDGFKSGIPKETPVRFSAEDRVPLVKGDPSALEQVVWNLFENAMKYGREGNTIDVEVTADERHVVIVVRDQGEGISSNDLPRIFDRFYRGQTSLQRRGFGLGLAYVQKVVMAHRGHVAVRSEPGRGAEFRVYLPAA